MNGEYFSCNDLSKAIGKHKADPLGRAVTGEADVFTFYGQKLVAKFAEYLLLYLQGLCRDKGIKESERIFSWKGEGNDLYIKEN